jgi:hypothetical protein
MSEPASRPPGSAAPAADATRAAPPLLPGSEDEERSAALSATLQSHSVSTKAVFTSMATLVSRGANILLLIVLTPFLFGGLGERLFGIYQLTQRIAQFGGLSSLGASTYLKIRLAELYSDQGVTERRKAIGDCVMQWLALLPLLVLWLILIYALVSGRTAVSNSQAVAVMVLIILTPLAQLLSIGNVALFTHHLGYVGVPLWTGIGICASAAAAALAYAGYGIEGVATALAAGTILNGMSSLALARKLLPWFGLEWPTLREFLGNLGTSLSASVASLVYLGLQQLEALIFGLGAGPVILARLVLTVIGIQCLDIVVRSFIGAGAYAAAPFVRNGQSARIGSLRAEAHGNIVVLFTIAAPVVVGLTPVVVPLWINDAVLLSPWVAAAILLTSMFRLLAVFDATLLDQARDFHWKNAAATAAVFVPGAALGFIVYWDVAPEGWYWLLPASIALYFTLAARRCSRVLGVTTAWTTLFIPVIIVLASAFATTALLEGRASEVAVCSAATVASAIGAAASWLHPQLVGPVRKLAERFRRAIARSR